MPTGYTYFTSKHLRECRTDSRPYAVSNAVIGDSLFLIHGSARYHTARLVEAMLEMEPIVYMEWSACCIELNMIQHIWDTLEGGTYVEAEPQFTIWDLEIDLLEEWNRIS